MLNGDKRVSLFQEQCTRESLVKTNLWRRYRFNFLCAPCVHRNRISSILTVQKCNAERKTSQKTQKIRFISEKFNRRQHVNTEFPDLSDIAVSIPLSMTKSVERTGQVKWHFWPLLKIFLSFVWPLVLQFGLWVTYAKVDLSFFEFNCFGHLRTGTKTPAVFWILFLVITGLFIPVVTTSWFPAMVNWPEMVQV